MLPRCPRGQAHQVEQQPAQQRAERRPQQGRGRQDGFGRGEFGCDRQCLPAPVPSLISKTPVRGSFGDQFSGLSAREKPLGWTFSHWGAALTIASGRSGKKWAVWTFERPRPSPLPSGRRRPRWSLQRAKTSARPHVRTQKARPQLTGTWRLPADEG